MNTQTFSRQQILLIRILAVVVLLALIIGGYFLAVHYPQEVASTVLVIGLVAAIAAATGGL